MLHLVFLVCVIISSVAALGGEKAAFTTTPEILPTDIGDDDFDTNTTWSISNRTTHRQNLCGRYELYRTRKIHLRNALKNLELNLLFTDSLAFRYTPEDGISSYYGGMAADLMDELATRAGFTWRQSFGWSLPAAAYNMTWTEQLWWGVNTYDMYINRWDQSLERMQMGIAFMDPWYDASIILIDKREKNTIYEDTYSFNTFWNWARPFDAAVWVLIAITIVVSGLVYQFLEYMDGERQDRAQSQWFYDNLYLSLLNFSSNFSYTPSSGAARIFSVSMAFWAMIVTATYTANLAGFMITQHRLAPTITNIVEAITQEIPICTYANTNSDMLIAERYPNAIRKPYVTELEMYEALNAGECGLLVDHVEGWANKQQSKRHNPDCNLARVQDDVASVRASFGLKADVGYKCTSLIRDVLNVHLREMIADGNLAKAWERYREQVRDNDCPVVSESNIRDREGRRLKEEKQQQTTNPQQRHRKLQTADSTGGNGSSEESLSVEDMIGTFLLHYGLMFLAILVSLANPWWTRWKHKRGWADPVPMELGLSRVPSYAVRRSPPMRLEDVNGDTDSFVDENESFGVPRRRRVTNTKAEDGVFRDNPEQALPPEKGVNEEVKAMLNQFERRQAQEMDEHMRMVVMMLNDMRKQNKKFQKDVLSGLGGAVDKRPSSVGDRSNSKRMSADFGRYLRQNLSSEIE